MASREYYERHRKQLLATGTVVAAVVITGWAMRSRADVQQYATVGVEQGSITSAVQATGTINPLTTVPVGSYVSGTVKYIFADFNSHVESGQVLALIDPQVHDAQLLQAHGGLDNAVANERNLRKWPLVAHETHRAETAVKGYPMDDLRDPCSRGNGLCSLTKRRRETARERIPPWTMIDFATRRKRPDMQNDAPIPYASIS